MFRYLGLSCILLLLAAPLSAEEKYWEYEFVNGDTIWSISHRFLKDWRNWDKLQKLNSVAEDTRMAPGARINIPVEWLDTASAPVNLASVTGDVSLFDTDGAQVTLVDGLEINAGYALETAEKASALLIFRDGSKLLVQQNTRIEFDTTSSVGAGLVYNYKLDLPKGEIENRANPQRTAGSTFLIETPSSTTATRGTIYRVRTDGVVTGTEVTKGLVGVGNDLGEAKVPAGFGLITEKGKKPRAPVQLLAAPTLPDSLGQFKYLPASITVPSVVGAKKMRLQASNSIDFDALSIDVLIDQSDWQLPLSIADGTYYVRLRGVDAAGLEGKNGSSQFTVAARPMPAAHISSDPANTFYNDAIELRWSEVDGASDYLLEVMLASDERAQVYRRRVTGTEHRFSLPNYGQFVWRVTGYSSTGSLGPTGHLGKFEAVIRPYRPISNKPRANVFVIEWPQPPSASYRVQIAADYEFDNVVFEQRYASGNSRINDLPTGQYFVRYQLLSDTETIVDSSTIHKIAWQP